jgi:hypothetical protein
MVALPPDRGTGALQALERSEDALGRHRDLGGTVATDWGLSCKPRSESAREDANQHHTAALRLLDELVDAIQTA